LVLNTSCGVERKLLLSAVGNIDKIHISKNKIVYKNQIVISMAFFLLALVGIVYEVSRLFPRLSAEKVPSSVKPVRL
jgi:hypothetical protein